MKAIPVRQVCGETGLEVGGVATDSRRVNAGDVFVALEGTRTDGHRYLVEAIERGACAVVSQKEPQDWDIAWIQTEDARKAAGLLSAKVAGEPAKKINLVGITGTNGKTTTTYLLDAILHRLHPPSAMMGTVVRRIGDEASSAEFTTPESPELQSFLVRAVEAGCRYGTLEISSHGLALGRVEGVEFAGAVFTNLSRDHLDFHHDMEEYFVTKCRLFERHLRAGASAVIGIDDSYGRRLAESLAGPVISYGFSREATLCIEELKTSFGGLELTIRERNAVRYLKSPLIGRHNALNLVAAYGAARSLGFDSEPVLQALGGARGAPGRNERVDMGQPFQVIVDYAHTDDALRNLLETTCAMPHRKVLTVFGCGGDRDRSKRPLMGAVATRLSDLVVLTSDNPRSEDPLAIMREIELGTKGRQSRSQVLFEPDRRKAIELALSMAGEGDVVLVTGKGHESYQVIGQQRIVFDDREVVREILAGGKRSPGSTEHGDIGGESCFTDGRNSRNRPRRNAGRGCFH